MVEPGSQSHSADALLVSTFVPKATHKLPVGVEIANRFLDGSANRLPSGVVCEFRPQDQGIVCGRNLVQFASLATVC